MRSDLEEKLNEIEERHYLKSCFYVDVLNLLQREPDAEIGPAILSRAGAEMRAEESWTAAADEFVGEEYRCSVRGAGQVSSGEDLPRSWHQQKNGVKYLPWQAVSGEIG